MAWRITVDGIEFDSDDMLLDDLAYVEETTGTYWSLANPWKDIKVAKAFLRVALVRSGISEEDADERVKSITLREAKAAFDFIEDAKAPARAEGKGGSRKGRTSRSSSPGAPGSSAGPRKKAAASD